MSGWRVADGNWIAANCDVACATAWDFVVPGGTVLGPDEYAVIWLGAPNPPITDSPAAVTLFALNGLLDRLQDSDDDVWVYDVAGRLVDRISWGSGVFVNTVPTPPLWDDTGNLALDNATSGTSIAFAGGDPDDSRCWEFTESGNASVVHRSDGNLRHETVTPLGLCLQEPATTFPSSRRTRATSSSTRCTPRVMRPRVHRDLQRRRQRRRPHRLDDLRRSSRLRGQSQRLRPQRALEPRPVPRDLEWSQCRPARRRTTCPADSHRIRIRAPRRRRRLRRAFYDAAGAFVDLRRLAMGRYATDARRTLGRRTHRSRSAWLRTSPRPRSP